MEANMVHLKRHLRAVRGAAALAAALRRELQ
jgi:hypothetical protein